VTAKLKLNRSSFSAVSLLPSPEFDRHCETADWKWCRCECKT